MSSQPPHGTVKPIPVRPKSDLMEPSLSARMERRDTEPCELDPESERSERQTIPPTLEQLAADAEHHRLVREAAQEASGILSSTLMQILDGQRRVEGKVDQILADRGRLAELEERVARIERCCMGCPRAGERDLGDVDGHG